MSKPVAVEADAQAQAGSVMYAPAVAGTPGWTPGNVNVTKYAKLKIGGQAVIHEAKCTFSFSGTDSNGAAVSGSEDVVLSAAAAGTTKLQKSANQVLRDGDSSDSTSGKSLYGNVVKISSSGKLKSG
jgi:hypothetical protein